MHGNVFFITQMNVLLYSSNKKLLFMENVLENVNCIYTVQENMSGQRGTLRPLAVICHSH